MQSTGFLRAGAVLTALVAITLSPLFASAADLQWRRGRAPAAKSAESVAPSNARRDAAVRQVAWDEPATSGPSLNGTATGQATLRSLVVQRDDESDAMRAAQLSQPAGPGGANLGTGEAGAGPAAQPDRDDFLRGLERPFGGEAEPQPTFRTPDFNRPGSEPMQQPDEPGTTQPGRTTPGPGTTPDRPDRFPPLGAESTLPAIERQPAGANGDNGSEQQRAQDLCAQELADLKASSLADVTLNITVAGTQGRDYPYECSIDDGSWHAGRCWPETIFMWKASALCHKPLYFEDEAMERYGHSWGPCCDPIVSGVHFFTTLPVLPYCMGVEPPTECIYALGHYRAGSCAPRMINPIPISPRGALFQAGAVVGVAAILP